VHKLPLEIKLVGGLGNQLYSIAAGLCLASRSNENFTFSPRALPFGSNKGRKYEFSQWEHPLGSKYKPPILGGLTAIIGSQLTRLGIKTNALKILENEHKFLGISQSPVTEISKYSDERVISGHFIHCGWFEMAKNFRFPNQLEIKAQSNSFRNVMKNFNSESISVHVRIGDFKNHLDLFPIIPEQYYLKCLEQIGI
jgi:hypothetical protein